MFSTAHTFTARLSHYYVEKNVNNVTNSDNSEHSSGESKPGVDFKFTEAKESDK